MKLSLEEILRLNIGLTLLDGYERVARDGDRERIVKEYFKLGAGFRVAVALNMDKLSPVISAYQKARNSLVFSLAGPDNFKVPDSGLAAFQRGEQEMFGQEYEVDLKMIAEADLRLDENPIPASTLSLIRSLLR